MIVIEEAPVQEGAGGGGGMMVAQKTATNRQQQQQMKKEQERKDKLQHHEVTLWDDEDEEEEPQDNNKEQVYEIIWQWFYECAKLRDLELSHSYFRFIVEYQMERAQENSISPMSEYRLRTEYPELYRKTMKL